MSDLTPKHFNHMLAGAGVAAVLFAGFTAAPAIFFPHGADAKEQAVELLQTVGLANRIDHYPVQLSGGEQQRVAVARAFACRPPILLADEPTGNLDSQTGRYIMDLVLALHRDYGATLVLVTHDREIASLMHRVVALRDGHIESDDILPRSVVHGNAL